MSNEPYLAGFMEYPERSRFYRHALAYRRYLNAVTMPVYESGLLYPCGKARIDSYAVRPDYSYTFTAQLSKLSDEDAAIVREEEELLPRPKAPHNVGGSGYTHSMPHFGRVLKEGLSGYQARVEKLPEGDFRDGLLEVLAGMREYTARCVEYLREADAPPVLISALGHVPFSPPRDFYEAMVAYNMIYYLDGCDNPGRIDEDLLPYYRGEDAVGLMRRFFQNVDDNDAWSSSIGPAYNDLTRVILRAIPGMRRPSLELRVTPDMPDDIWELACEAIASGGGQPALYNEDAFQKKLAEVFPYIPKEDLMRFNGGGCTETMLAGISNVGSLDAGINLPLIFVEFMHAHLKDCPTFGMFVAELLQEIRRVTLETLDGVNEFRRARALYRPQPVRTLLVEDCIERGLDFNAGGARWSWSVVNIAGIPNVLDSLLAIRELIYRKGYYNADGFLKALESRDALFLKRCDAAPHYGVADPDADELAHDFTKAVYEFFGERIPCTGGAFLPSSIQFVTYGTAGKIVSATPDGRADGTPLADSLAPIFARDTEGPTALLQSAAALNLPELLGTPVLNLRLSRAYIKDHLRALTEGFFAQGGMQLQVSCMSREDMLDAREHPENHKNLIVRVGGYSEYFIRLSDDIQLAVLARTEHDV